MKPLMDATRMINSMRDAATGRASFLSSIIKVSGGGGGASDGSKLFNLMENLRMFIDAYTASSFLSQPRA